MYTSFALYFIYSKLSRKILKIPLKSFSYRKRSFPFYEALLFCYSSALEAKRGHKKVFSICFYWLLQDTQLYHDAQEGVILTNRSLVLQGIDRTRSGGYTCQAVNAVGNGQSQVIDLDVKCKSKFWTWFYRIGSNFLWILKISIHLILAGSKFAAEFASAPLNKIIQLKGALFWVNQKIVDASAI